MVVEKDNYGQKPRSEKSLEDGDFNTACHQDIPDQPAPSAAPPDANGSSTSVNEKEEEDDDKFDVTWDGEHDPEDPKTMAWWRKWLIVVIIATSSLCVTCNSSIYTTTYDQLDPKFRISREVATLGLTTFVLGLM